MPADERHAPATDAPTRSRAFAPGRVNLIGEHTDYNNGLALPFAIAEGVTVSATAAPAGSREASRVLAYARDLGEHDDFALADPEHVSGWRAFVRGIVAELAYADVPLVGVSLEISGGPPRGAGLSSSAALEVALCLALADIGAQATVAGSRCNGDTGHGKPGSRSDGDARHSEPGSRSDGDARHSEPGSRSDGDAEHGAPSSGQAKPLPLPLPRIDVARLCARVENNWVGAHTGLLDQLASLYGAPHTALCIDFLTLDVEPVPLALGDWRLVVLDSGERHLHASSGYNQRRSECARACTLLGVASLRDATLAHAHQLPEPLNRRALHVIEENQRVREAVVALRSNDLPTLGKLLDAAHRSLRENYEISTAAVEAAVARLRDAGASGARLVGGGFGGSVLGLFAPGTKPPLDARDVRPGPGAHLLEP